MTDDTATDIVDLNAPEAADDLSDLTADDYQAAAEILALEAAQAQETAEDDGRALSPRDQRYRQRLRDAEAENDRLRGLVDAMQADEVARLAAAKLADPGDLFRDGLTVADLCDDGGRVDPARVDGAITEVLQQHPHWAAPVAAYRGPLHSGATPIPLEPPSKKFADAFTPASE
ncbi:Uncharacterised protein [Mycolicibacterium fortuitum]|uniref:Uncharacterized protein n=1 Tax=Mycolicibacterium fortuitum TaxID=1766 RepID=A0A378UYA1_MYCFO|nr:Uncharacterised protein [Mycolicibacterium fortuitum]